MNIATHLAQGSWLTRERMRNIAVILVVVSLLGAFFLWFTANGKVDAQGRPLGTDYANIYVAGLQVHEGHAADVFDPALQNAREQAFFHDDIPFYGWHYPPFFLFVAALLALMPYGLSLLVWQGVTFALYLLTTRRLCFGALSEAKEAMAPHGRLVTLFVAAYPAVFINFGHGHNGFLSAALLGGALYFLRHRPILAGVLIGLLSYKPQFGLLVPLVLMATGRWKAFAAATVTVLALIALTTVVYGLSVWEAFFAFSEFSRTVVLEQGGAGWFKIQSIFSWVRMWGGSVGAAYAVHGAILLVVAVATVWLWRSSAAFALKAAALCIASAVATPYVMDYDLMIIAPAIACWVGHGMQHGFIRWEKTTIAALWLMPYFARVVTQYTYVPLGVLTLGVALVMLVCRAKSEKYI